MIAGSFDAVLTHRLLANAPFQIVRDAAGVKPEQLARLIQPVCWTRDFPTYPASAINLRGPRLMETKSDPFTVTPGLTRGPAATHPFAEEKRDDGRREQISVPHDARPRSLSLSVST